MWSPTWRRWVWACYTSPYFTAAPGSTHGYDVSDHNEINPELGGVEALAGVHGRARGARPRHVADFVPNHMGIGTGRNARWNDVLENGPSSPAAAFFDIEWRPRPRSCRPSCCCPSSAISTGGCSSAAS